MKTLILLFAVLLIFSGGVLVGPDLFSPETSTRALLGMAVVSWGITILMALLGGKK